MKLPTTTKASSSSKATADATATILGLGSLLSERSSRVTFPELVNFRLGRVRGYRRVFGHPASIFFQRGLARPDTLEFASLAAEETTGDGSGDGFVCSVFEVPREQVFEKKYEPDDDETTGSVLWTSTPTGAFLEREEEFDIVEVPYVDLSDEEKTASTDTGASEPSKRGVLCTRFADAGYLDRWGTDRFEDHYAKYGISTIWGWTHDSGLLPCPVYLRHCYLAARSMGPICFGSFLDETYLADRATTIREYLSQHPNLIESSVPPPGFEDRYNG